MSNEKVDEMMSVGAGVVAGMPDADPPELTPVRKKKKFKVLRRKLMGEAVTTKPSGNGYHDVYVNGEKHPDYEVVNGAGGNASMGKQTYGIRKGDKVQWVGCLKDTRKRLNKMLGESGPLSGKPKKLKPLTPKKPEPLRDRLARINKRGAGSPGAVKIKDWLADKKRRVAEYKKEREERMKNRERRDENT